MITVDQTPLTIRTYHRRHHQTRLLADSRRLCLEHGSVNLKQETALWWTTPLAEAGTAPPGQANAIAGDDNRALSPN